MVNKTIDIEPYRPGIEALIDQKTPYKNIAAWLESTHHVRINPDVLAKKCRELGIIRNVRRTLNDEVVGFIGEQYYHTFDNDQTISDDLREKGHHIPAAHIASIRIDLGLKRRFREGEDGPKQQEINQIVEEALDTGHVRQYGARFLQSALRTDGCHASRDQVIKALHKHAPEGVESRTHEAGRRKRRPYFVTKGPNWSWSMDGHAKLSRWGIEIYGCIDSYSRFMLWLYVGHSATTQISVAKQFLDCIRKYNIFPRRGRSDRGVEALMPADFAFNLYRQWLLCQKICTPNELEQFPLTDTWVFGPSTKNVRIESWWNMLEKQQLYPWVNYFKDLEASGYWNGTEADRAVFLFVFMPIIQEECSRFVDYWNCHYIRKQTKRPNVVPGRPKDLYNRPEAAVENHGRVPYIPTLDRLSELVADYDQSLYLPLTTQAWCALKLGQLGLNRVPQANDFIDQRTYEVPEWYKKLIWAGRELQEQEILVDRELRTLRTLPKPRGGYDYPAAAEVVRDWQSNEDTSVLVEAVENFAELDQADASTID